MNGARNIKYFLAAPPRAMGRGQKVKYLISITKLISKIFIPNFMLFSQMKIQNISDSFFILLPGSCPRGGTWGYLGTKIKFCPAFCPLCYLLLNHRTKFNQIWCVSNGASNINVFLAPPPGPWRGVKRSNII